MLTSPVQARRFKSPPVDSSLIGTNADGWQLGSLEGNPAMPDPREPNPDHVVPIPGQEPRPINEPEPDRLPDEEPNPNPDETREPPMRAEGGPPRPEPDPLPPAPPGPLPGPGPEPMPTRRRRFPGNESARLRIGGLFVISDIAAGRASPNSYLSTVDEQGAVGCERKSCFRPSDEGGSVDGLFRTSQPDRVSGRDKAPEKGL